MTSNNGAMSSASEPELWLRHTSHLCLTAPVESSLCINLVQESKKKYVLINSLDEPSQQVSQKRRKRDCEVLGLVRKQLSKACSFAKTV